MILVIDNYDSFTYNLVDILSCNHEWVHVYKNDVLTLDMIKDMNPSGILISPGPGTPSTAGICLEVVKKFYKKIPILGICLGHQIIAEAIGGNVIQAKNIIHGKSDIIFHDAIGIFKDIPQAFIATRYHSLIVEEHSLPNTLIITARSKFDQTIMGIRHMHYPLQGLQFHPESYLTSHGTLIIKNFIQQTKNGGKHV